ncbi:uncharacterized protein F4812DRAFT_460237 [Daldinia caldariorum]|uniref:uncharacterized protein n=1 Tax=Daldinia caldariorum TaxID=326644 RepID=UPI0020083AB3|nr:uncharacterized protein F4812DRAFT_460237 [Daldinia caldariorum]KAI1466676.1 hypothetical protein F4812DRAFT_460237 [Daldinia caldariorum]
MPDPIKVIYIVFRKDFDDSDTEEDGRLAPPIGIFRSADTANEAAKLHCKMQARNKSYDGNDTEHELRDGLYVGWCYTLEHWRDYFEVWVEMKKFDDAEETPETRKRNFLEEAAENSRRAQNAPRAKYYWRSQT